MSGLTVACLAVIGARTIAAIARGAGCAIGATAAGARIGGLAGVAGLAGGSRLGCLLSHSEGWSECDRGPEKNCR